MYSRWLMEFWMSTWNVFDFVVVAAALLSLAFESLPGVSILRLMRAFRVFRLFKRLESLHKILTGISNAVPGVANAFAVVLIAQMMYAIAGVQFFGLDYPYFFGSFARAL